ncbi:MAG: hypothetical protein U0521_01320 [Anaerolineae bacterium]
MKIRFLDAGFTAKSTIRSRGSVERIQLRLNFRQIACGIGGVLTVRRESR